MDPWIDKLQSLSWPELLIGAASRFGGALLVLLIGLRVSRWIANLAARGLLRAEVEQTAAQFMNKVVYVALLVLLLLTVLAMLGVPMTSAFAVLGAAGLAIGLALKDSLSNIASGVMLVTLKPFRAGDAVTINGETGTVEMISIFQTRLRGGNNQSIVLPNSLITTNSIINHTPDTRRRVELIVGIGYKDSIDSARKIVLELMHADPRILREPEPDVLVYALAENSVNLGIRCHTNNDDNFAVKCELTENIKKAFDVAGIGMPYPQRDVHVYHYDKDGTPRT